MNYFERPGMSNSKLTAFKWELERGHRGSEGTNFSDKAKDIGHLFHAYLFEPHLYDQILAECVSEIDMKDMKMLAGMKTVSGQFKTLQFFLTHPATKFEEEHYGQLCGLDFKGKMDAINHEMRAIGDGKSTSARTLEQFLESCTKYGYWRQAYIYMMLSGYNTFFFWGISKFKPHNTFFVNVADYPMEMANAAIEVTWLCGEYIKMQEQKVKDAEFRVRVLEILKAVKD
jgi:hypothetical protein